MKQLLELGVLLTTMLGSLLLAFFIGSVLTLGENVSHLDALILGVLLMGVGAGAKCIWRLTQNLTSRFAKTLKVPQ